MKHLIAFALLGMFISSVKAQGPEIGSWRDHLPYDHLTGVVQSGDLIYLSTPYSMYTYNVSDNSVEKLIKGKEISDIGISRMDYSTDQRTVVVGYSNGNLDLIKGNSTINIPAIKNSSISGDKNIYNIHCTDNWAYLATGFGIVVIDIAKEEVKDTYIIGAGGTQSKIWDVTTDDTKIYAAMEDGLREADLSNNFLSDFSQWTLRSDLPVSMAGKEVNLVQQFQNDLFVCFAADGSDNDSIFAYRSGTWILDTITDGKDTHTMRVENGRLIAVHTSNVAALDSLNNVHYIQWNYNGYSPKLNDAYHDGTNFWLATEFEGLIRAESNWSNYAILPVGPLYVENFKLNMIDQELWVAGGSIFGNLGSNGYQRQGVYRFKDESWQTYNRFTLPTSLIDSSGAYDFTYVTVNPNDLNNIFISSKSEMGLIEMQNGSVVNVFNKNNSTLTEITGQTDFYETSQGHFDDDGNLWITASRTTTPISVMDPSGNWHALGCASLGSSTRLTRSVLDENGILWAAAINTGVLAHNSNGTPTDPTDDQCKILNNGIGTGNLPSQQVNCMALDLDGELWIGTEQGPAVIYNTANVFDGGDYDAQQILIEQDGNIQLLLETESITSITVDGANRKWIGTSTSGAYLISEDGTEQILHFTETNSPLPSNDIKDIVINGETGEIFFGTLNGIVSYKYNATEGEDNYNEVFAYPNPVRPEYDGTIAIKGLLRDSDVKITDVSGNLVYETTSFGGQATWDGNTYDGLRVTSGVYLVFATDQNGDSSVVTKIAIIN